MAKSKALPKAKALKTLEKVNPPQIKASLSPPRVFKLLISLSLAVATLFLFWPLGNYEFINFDDGEYVYGNPQVKAGLTLKGMIWAFTTTQTGNWHPLTWLSHMVDCEFYGLSSGGHHLTNVLIHIASTLLLFLVLERMTRALWRSSLVAALFALHPLHVESVAWVAERKDVLSTFFWMLTLWTYVRYTERPKLNRYLTVLLSFVLGLLSKAMLVTLPCVMLLLDYWPLERFQFGGPRGDGNRAGRESMNRDDPRAFSHRFVLEKVPFFALSAVSSVVTFLAQQSVGAVRPLEWFPLGPRIANALVSYLSYIGKMIWPHPLAILYPYPGILSLWQVVGAGSVLVCVSVWAVRASRKHPYLGVGWLWYLGTLVPVIGLVQVGVQATADRYTYVPLIGLFIMIAWGVPDILAGWRYRKTVLAISAGVLLSILMPVTRLQIQKWHDPITIFTHTLKVTTRNYLIHNNLGVALADRGKNQEAMAHYTEALRINPNYVEAYNNLGNALARQGKNQEALAYYKEALRVDPHYAGSHYNLGVVLAEQGKNQEALAYYREALRINPDYAEAHNNLANALARQGKSEEAMAHYTEALRINPQYADAHYNVGVLLARIGKNEEALAHYTEALRINPNFFDAHNILGVALSRQGKTQEAMAHFTEALRIKPDDAGTHINLGNSLAEQGKNEEAIPYFTEALRINPNFFDAHNNLGVALSRQGKKQEAIIHFAEALRIKADNADVHINLGNTLAERGRIEEAIPHFTAALRIKPDFAEAHFSLGMAYFMVGKRDSALEEYKILKKINPNLANTLSQKILK